VSDRAELLNYRIRGEVNWDYPGPFDNPYKREQKEFFAGIRFGQLINSGDYMAKSTMPAILGQVVCYTGVQMSWRKAAGSDFAFAPRDCDFNTEPPVKPGPDGLYPVAVPGVTKLIEGT
jgi:myo-inositol 2-dehydrogenase / D-chiro-inositol 1-dehydrogenase